ncbi:MAG: hypothetical protein ACYDHP_00115 [Ferrimicrobium sp.]
MANNERARRVARAQATGRTARVRREIPVGFYTSLVVLVALGIGAVGYSKYELAHPLSTTVSKVQPSVGTTWYTALGFDSCGSFAPVLAATPASSKSFIRALGDGVLKIAPKNAKQTGGHANLAAFIDGYPKLSVGASGYQLPGAARTSISAGCHGKPAIFGIYVWSSLLATVPTVYTSPSAVRLYNDSVVTVAVVAKGTKVTQPPTATNLANVGASSKPAG